MASEATDLGRVFVELGAATLGLALLSRFASRVGFSAIPLYLLAGLAFGNGGLLPLHFSESFVHVGAEIGVVLLLFTLGLEYTGSELVENLREGAAAGVFDFVTSFPPGFALGLLLGWDVPFAAAFGGVTYVSSSGIIAKVLNELHRQSDPETAIVVSILVLEDLAMALYLPLLTVALSGGGSAAPVVIAVLVVATVLLIAVRFGPALSRGFAHRSDEVILLTAFGAVLLVAGIAQRMQVSAAVGAFLVGIAFSGPIAEHARRVIAPVRDLFAAVFFFFFGVTIAPAGIVPVLPLAAALLAVTSLTKLAAGWYAAKRRGLAPVLRARVGATLIARGEFSIVIAGLAESAGAPPRLASLAAAYVLLCAFAGPLAARFVDPLFARMAPRTAGRGR